MRTVKLVASVSCLFIFFCLNGCVITDFVQPEEPPKAEEIADGYLGTELKVTDAAEVLNIIHMPEHTVLSQSSSIVAASGQKNKGFRNWFNMVAFDEDDLMATRKYVFIMNERPKVLFNDTWPQFTYDSQCILPSETLDEPYADASSRRIAVLEYIKTTLAADMSEVKADNKNLAVLGMALNQTLGRVLIRLKDSPALATKLDDEKGLEFDHINMEKIKVRLVIEGDIVILKMRAGSCVNKFEDLKGTADKDKEKTEQ